MKKTVLRYGGFAALFLVIYFTLSWVLMPDPSFKTQEILGWVGILLSTSFVFFGLKYYRDRQNQGVLSFGKGILIGLLILLAPSLLFGLFNIIYTEYMDPEWLDKYYNYQVEQIRAHYPAAEVNGKVQDMEKQRALYASPAVQFGAMFASVFLVGLIVTVISALVLRRSREKAATQKAFA